MPIVCIYKWMEVNMYNNQILDGHVEHVRQLFLDGKYNTNMHVFFLFCNKYLEVPTLNLTFNIYTSAYQFRISNKHKKNVVYFH